MTLQLTPAARTHFGYFDGPDAHTPAYDPGPDAPCPFCGKCLAGQPVRTTCILLLDDADGPTLSLFYRAHRQCMDKAGEAACATKEHELLDLLLTDPSPQPRAGARPFTHAADLLARVLRRRRPPAAAG